LNHWRSYLRGRICEAFGASEAAIAAYRETLALAPSFARAASRAAYLLALHERFGEAEPLFRAAIAADPDSAAAHFNYGFNLDKHGRPQEAVAAFREAARLRPGLDRAWYGLGMALARLGQHQQAVKALEKAAELQPMNPHAWYALGMAHHAVGDTDRVKDVALHLVRFDPRMTRRLIQESGVKGLEYLIRDLVV
jgi:tetratricopeptide (TPR) repeat protein